MATGPGERGLQGLKEAGGRLPPGASLKTSSAAPDLCPVRLPTSKAVREETCVVSGS